MKSLIDRIVTAVLHPMSLDPDFRAVRLSQAEISTELDHGRDAAPELRRHFTSATLDVQVFPAESARTT